MNRENHGFWRDLSYFFELFFEGQRSLSHV